MADVIKFNKSEFLLIFIANGVKLNISVRQKINEHSILVIRNLSFRSAIAFQRSYILSYPEIIFRISNILTRCT